MTRERPRCQGVTWAGAPCRLSAKEGGFCRYHSPTRPRCQATINDGELFCWRRPVSEGMCLGHCPPIKWPDEEEYPDLPCTWCQDYQAVPGEEFCLRCARLWEGHRAHVTP